MEALRKYPKTDPDSPEGRALLGGHFNPQSAPDIRRNLQKVAMGTQTPRNQFVGFAFGVYNQGMKQRKRQKQKE